jgi:hypothetical protein
MMNTLKLAARWIFVLGSIIAFVSCDDEEATPEENNEMIGEFMNCRITVITRENFADDVFTYDDNGKLIGFVDGNASYEYTYNGNTTIVKYYYNDELQRTETVANNDSGFATHVVAVYESEATPTRTTDYQYDDKNQLVKKIVKNQGSDDEDVTVYEWVDGNVVSETEVDDDDVTTYTYLSELTQPAEWFNELNLGRGYVTIRTKNRVNKITTPSGTTYVHSYDEDDNGRIETIAIAPSNNPTYFKEFTYECD